MRQCSIIILLVSALLCGCASKPVTIGYEPDRFGVPSCVVDGIRQEMTDEERRKIAQAFVNEYCPR